MMSEFGTCIRIFCGHAIIDRVRYSSIWFVQDSQEGRPCMPGLWPFEVRHTLGYALGHQDLKWWKARHAGPSLVQRGKNQKHSRSIQVPWYLEWKRKIWIGRTENPNSTLKDPQRLTQLFSGISSSLGVHSPDTACLTIRRILQKPSANATRSLVTWNIHSLIINIKQHKHKLSNERGFWLSKYCNNSATVMASM